MNKQNGPRIVDRRVGKKKYIAPTLRRILKSPSYWVKTYSDNKDLDAIWVPIFGCYDEAVEVCYRALKKEEINRVMILSGSVVRNQEPRADEILGEIFPVPESEISNPIDEANKQLEANLRLNYDQWKKTSDNGFSSGCAACKPDPNLL